MDPYSTLNLLNSIAALLELYWTGSEEPDYHSSDYDDEILLRLEKDAFVLSALRAGDSTGRKDYYNELLYVNLSVQVFSTVFPLFVTKKKFCTVHFFSLVLYPDFFKRNDTLLMLTCMMTVMAFRIFERIPSNSWIFCPICLLIEGWWI